MQGFYGCAFVGRQVRVEVRGDEFFLDLLFFRPDQLRYVVVELKTGKFEPAHLGQMQFYVGVVDEQKRRPGKHAPTVGILVCSSRNEEVVRFALGSASSPMGVATYTYDTLPAAERALLPAAEDIAAAIQPTPTLDEPFAQQLLDELAVILPRLQHRRSLARARNTLLDIRHGCDHEQLVARVRERFSNGFDVQLTDTDADRIVDAIRRAYNDQDLEHRADRRGPDRPRGVDRRAEAH